jgi:hypothetical protein
MRTFIFAAVAVLWVSLVHAEAAPADFADHPVNVWVKQSPRADAPSPKFGWEGSGGYDPYIGKWIHWGGHDGIPQGFHLFLWDPHTGVWEQRFPDTSPPGVCCVDGAETFDLANRRFVRFPGASLNHGWQWSRKVRLKNSAVWLYDPVASTWTNMRPPPYQEPEKYSKEVLGSLNACGTYDDRHQVALSFGGQGAGGGMSNLFAYDAYANCLERLETENPPSPRDGSGFCYDSTNDCAVVFGSQYLTDEKTYIYRYATNKWEAHDLKPCPTARKDGPYSTIPKMAFDSTNSVCLCLIWLGEKGGHETWAFDAAKLTWTKLSPPAQPEPSKSRARNLGYDRSLNLFFLETWSVGGEPQVWTYRYRKSPAEAAIEPPTDLSCTTAEGGKATLSWTASPTPSVKQYNVYRAQAETPWLAQYARVGTVRQPSFEDSGLAKGKVYFYTVRAEDDDGRESRDSYHARTQPRVLLKPIVSILAPDRIEVTWNPHPAADVAGYNVYRGRVTVTTNTALNKSWAFNDPPYADPVVDGVRDITDIQKLNDRRLTTPSYTDDKVNLREPGPESGDYRYAVYVYILRAVNKLGTESGPSPYALTIPSEPQHVLLRERGRMAEIKWAANPERGIAGYRVYKYGNPMKLVTQELIKGPAFTDDSAGSHGRYTVVAVDVLGQEGEPSTPVWHGQSYSGFFAGEWHQ